ncbi:MAG: M48 family metallopeptidase [Proteobacteria bacterium]|nr:M48 family metallopeptidase [Pseudomonadota bacterium]MBU1639330.1 M48 family metallopeptidase [Pseudomonadota bacterium]
MSPTIILYLIITIVIADYLLERTLSFLNCRNISTELPDEVKGIYSEEKYQQSQEYKKANCRFELVTASLKVMILLALLMVGGFAFVDELARGMVQTEMLVSLLFFGLLMFASEILFLPFGLYHTFVLEERFAFNKTTLATFITDKLKGWLLIVILGGPLLAAVIWFYQITQGAFWIYAWLLMSGFMILMTMFYSTLIVPLFNKQTPLEQGELRDAIEAFSTKAGFQLDNVFVIDGSRRSSKANAYFSGLGAKKRIVLYDTLINDLEVEELVAVLAHEIGHYKKKHTTKGIVLALCQTGIMLYILSLFIAKPVLSAALGADIHSFHLALISFAILYSPLATLMGLVMNSFSRKNEYEADRFAAQYLNAAALASALKKLSINNLSNLTPHPAYVFFHYSHPPLLQRLRAMSTT